MHLLKKETRGVRVAAQCCLQADTVVAKKFSIVAELDKHNAQHKTHVSASADIVASNR